MLNKSLHEKRRYDYLDIFKYKRIIVIGNNGSGKSYISDKISEITRLPVIHLDMLYWRPNWEVPSNDEWTSIQKELVEKNEWIIDGNHTTTLELRFASSDLILFLDLNRIKCLISVLKRHSKKRIGSPEYLEYKFDKAFWAFCSRLWSFSKTRKPIILSLHKKYPDKQFFVIKKRKNANKFLRIWEEQVQQKHSNQQGLRR